MGTFAGKFSARDTAAAGRIERILYQEIPDSCVARTDKDFELCGIVDKQTYRIGSGEPLLRKLVPYLAKGWIAVYDDDGLAGRLHFDWQIERCEFDPEKRVWLCRTGTNFFNVSDILSDGDCATLHTALQKNGSPDMRRIEKRLFEGQVRVVGEETTA